MLNTQNIVFGKRNSVTSLDVSELTRQYLIFSVFVFSLSLFHSESVCQGGSNEHLSFSIHIWKRNSQGHQENFGSAPLTSTPTISNTSTTYALREQSSIFTVLSSNWWSYEIQDSRRGQNHFNAPFIPNSQVFLYFKNVIFMR